MSHTKKLGTLSIFGDMIASMLNQYQNKNIYLKKKICIKKNVFWQSVVGKKKKNESCVDF